MGKPPWLRVARQGTIRLNAAAVKALGLPKTGPEKTDMLGVVLYYAKNIHTVRLQITTGVEHPDQLKTALARDGSLTVRGKKFFTYFAIDLQSVQGKYRFKIFPPLRGEKEITVDFKLRKAKININKEDSK
jgi:hypothetical protein